MPHSVSVWPFNVLWYAKKSAFRGNEQKVASVQHVGPPISSQSAVTLAVLGLTGLHADEQPRAERLLLSTTDACCTAGTF
jgi:hypothetical protein